MVKTRKNVAVLMNLNRPYDRQLVHGIARYMRLHDAWLLYVEENPADRIPAFTEWAGDGLIVDLDDRKIAEAVPHFKAAAVGIGAAAPAVLQRLKISTVRTDDEMIAQWAANHLREKGLEQFAYCGVPTRGLDRWARIRREAFCRRVAEHGRPCSVFHGRQYAPRHWAQVPGQLTQWVRQLPKPVGIMACNDVLGRRVLEACRQLELHVPDEVAVIGVDNDELMCELAVPPLTSVAIGAEEIGYRAAVLLDKLMAGRTARPQHLVVPPACLVPRQSTDTVAVADPVVSRAMRFIRERAAKGIGVLDVARHAEVSRSTLEARFKHCLGRTVHGEMERVRLEAARRLLTTTKLPLEAVAQRAGYSSAQYLSAVFRRQLGHPPGQLRERRSGFTQAISSSPEDDVPG